jgi:hypothetical protein
MVQQVKAQSPERFPVPAIGVSIFLPFGGEENLAVTGT